MVRIGTEPVRGMRDILPPDSEEILWLEKVFTDVVRSYGYSAVITPTIELFRLFEVKSGPEIRRSMYVFKDKGGRVVCLRPEFTASIARIYLRALTPEPKPIKLYYVGPAFRYEEPQKGRFREFIQAGIEYIGSSSTYSDIETLLTVRDYYRAVGLKEYSVKMNSMSIYRSLFSLWGIPEDVQDQVIHYLDKGLLDDALRTIRGFKEADPELIRAFSGKVMRDPDELIDYGRELRLPEDLISELGRLAEIFRAVKDSGVPDAYVDLGFARGLAYYTGFIFEVKVPQLQFSIGGGGRYDTLISLYGGAETPSTGYSLGIDRLHLALKAQGWSLPERVRKALLIALVRDYGFVDKVATELRLKGLTVDVRFGGKLGDHLSYASRKGYDYAIILGSKELSTSSLTIRDLRGREQWSIPLSRLKEEELG